MQRLTLQCEGTGNRARAAFVKEHPLRAQSCSSYLASNSMRSVLLMPSGISLGIAAMQVLNKSILGFLSPLQKQFIINKGPENLFQYTGNVFSIACHNYGGNKHFYQ